MTEPIDFDLIAGMLDAYVESIKEHGGAMLDRWHYVPQVEGAAEDLRAFALSASPAPAEPVQQDTRDKAVAWMVKWYGSDGHEFVNASASKLVAQQHALRVGGKVIDLYATPHPVQPEEAVARDAARWRRLVNASELSFPVATIAEDPENDCTLIFGRKRLEDFIDRCDEISDNYFSRQQDAGGAKG